MIKYFICITLSLLLSNLKLSAQKAYSFTKIRVKNEIRTDRIFLFLDTTENHRKISVELIKNLNKELNNLGVECLFGFKYPTDSANTLVIKLKELKTEEITLNRICYGSRPILSYRFELKQINLQPTSFWKIWTELSISKEKADKGIKQASEALAKKIYKALIPD